MKFRLLFVLTLFLFAVTLVTRSELMASVPMVTQALPYPFISTAYRSLGQEQVTFNPYLTQMPKQDAESLREIFILVDRATYIGVQTLWWMESNGKQGRSEKVYRIQINKLIQRFERVKVDENLRVIKNLILLGMKAQRDELLSKEAFSFENKKVSSEYFLGQAYELLFSKYGFENPRNQKAFNCHLSALAAIEIRVRGFKTAR